VAILPIADKHIEYAENILKLLKKCEIRALVDVRPEKIGKKIRDAELQKIPYMLIIGDKELEEKKVAVRRHGKGDIGAEDAESFVARLNEEIKEIVGN
jgi:threonyl-tRNA synthetase